MEDLLGLLDFGPVFENGDRILEGFWGTIRLALMSALLSMVIGTIAVSFRVAPIPLLRVVGTVYVNVVRNTPLTLVLLLCSLGISTTLQLKFSDQNTVDAYWWAIIGLSFYTGAFICEVLRSGINTVPLGQAEAARSIGLTFTQSLRMIILPQAFRTVIAPLGSTLIAMIKNTTVVMAAGYAEAALAMYELFDDPNNQPPAIPLFLTIAAGFMVLTLPTGFFFGWLAKRMAVAR